MNYPSPLKLDEFSLIDHYFKNSTLARADVLLGIGDDAALLQVPINQLLVLSMDTLVEGVHFPVDTLPFNIGYKALAVNLSDLAAMGAEPAWITLALTLPTLDATWLKDFAEGLFSLAKQFNVQLIGGDTTRGPLTITIQAHGFVPSQKVLSRQGAKIGDKIYVSGTLGDAGLGLQVALKKCDLTDDDKQVVLQRLNAPTPRVELGMLLREFASSAIDISDGLLADLSHVLKASQVGAHIIVEDLPLSSILHKLPSEKAHELALTAGDDYELCFTIPIEKEKEFLASLSHLDVSCRCIGEIKKEEGLRLSGLSNKLTRLGFRHF